MGFWDNLLGRNKLPISLLTPRVTVLGGAEEYAANLGASSPSDLWSSQPHLRTVVSFLARNVAQLGLHSFERVGEDRRRDRTSPFAATMLRPNDDQTAFDLIYSLVGDMALYDRAYWLVAPDSSASGWMFRRLPPAWVSENPRDAFGAKSYDVIAPDQSVVTVPADSVLAFTGYHPQNPSKGSPTIEALKDLLREQSEAATYRAQVWKRGGRVSAVLQRPAGAPDWSPEARDRFREDWYAKFTGRGERAGGTPILEDGMTLNRVDFSAQEQQFVDVAKLAVTTVAAAFHVNPTMIGVLDNANYSNVREFRRMLYGDTLGPLLAQIEARVNTFLLPMLEMDPATHYAEFNIGEKLQGSFEEQAQVMQTLVGAPLMTRDEGRARFNLPALGGDAEGLVTPLNVLIGGQASPTDSGTQNQTIGSSAITAPVKTAGALGGTLGVKSEPTDSQRDKVAEVLAGFFARQGKTVLSALGAGEDWWDGDRWDRELADDLLRVSLALSTVLGKAEAERLGYADGYDPDRTIAYLRTVAERYAGNVNTTTKSQIDAALDADEPPAAVFDGAPERAVGVATAVSTFVAGFGATEAGQQIAYEHGVEPTKTWNVNSKTPRPSHARMSGQTVPVGEPFSNGLMWPADSPDVDEVAGCKCSVTITIP